MSVSFFKSLFKCVYLDLNLPDLYFILDIHKVSVICVSSIIAILVKKESFNQSCEPYFLLDFGGRLDVLASNERVLLLSLLRDM